MQYFIIFDGTSAMFIPVDEYDPCEHEKLDPREFDDHDLSEESEGSEIVRRANYEAAEPHIKIMYL